MILVWETSKNRHRERPKGAWRSIYLLEFKRIHGLLQSFAPRNDTVFRGSLWYNKIKNLFQGLLNIGLMVVGGCTSSTNIPDYSFLQPTVLEVKTEKTSPTPIFFLQAYLPVNVLAGEQKCQRVRIYIEGDGYAWVNRNTPSPDPTPKDPIGLQLALKDFQAHSTANSLSSHCVVYLARPCQFIKTSNSLCADRHWWTSRRFAPFILEVMNNAITQIKEQCGAKEIELVGFSGGGAISLLLGAYREGMVMKNYRENRKLSLIKMHLKASPKDVRRIITVAGCLDHTAWTQYHGVTPLHDSLNPADYLESLAAIPQIHYVGADDKIVPPILAYEFSNQKALQKKPPTIVNVPSATHSNWGNFWSSILQDLQ